MHNLCPFFLFSARLGNAFENASFRLHSEKAFLSLSLLPPCLLNTKIFLVEMGLRSIKSHLYCTRSPTQSLQREKRRKKILFCSRSVSIWWLLVGGTEALFFLAAPTLILFHGRRISHTQLRTDGLRRSALFFSSMRGVSSGVRRHSFAVSSSSHGRKKVLLQLAMVFLFSTLVIEA